MITRGVGVAVSPGVETAVGLEVRLAVGVLVAVPVLLGVQVGPGVPAIPSNAASSMVRLGMAAPDGGSGVGPLQGKKVADRVA